MVFSNGNSFSLTYLSSIAKEIEENYLDKLLQKSTMSIGSRKSICYTDRDGVNRAIYEKTYKNLNRKYRKELGKLLKYHQLSYSFAIDHLYIRPELIMDINEDYLNATFTSTLKLRYKFNEGTGTYLPNREGDSREKRNN